MNSFNKTGFVQMDLQEIQSANGSAGAVALPITAEGGGFTMHSPKVVFTKNAEIGTSASLEVDGEEMTREDKAHFYRETFKGSAF